MSGEELVIRRVKRRKKAGHHGGAWKIALADFALAMMAFFWFFGSLTWRHRKNWRQLKAILMIL